MNLKAAKIYFSTDKILFSIAEFFPINDINAILSYIANFGTRAQSIDYSIFTGRKGHHNLLLPSRWKEIKSLLF